MLNMYVYLPISLHTVMRDLLFQAWIGVHASDWCLLTKTMQQFISLAGIPFEGLFMLWCNAAAAKQQNHFMHEQTSMSKWQAQTGMSTRA